MKLVADFHLIQLFYFRNYIEKIETLNYLIKCLEELSKEEQNFFICSQCRSQLGNVPKNRENV